MRDAVLCFDLGMSSGRLMAVFFENKRLFYEEITRFENKTVVVDGTLRWDLSLFKKNFRFALEQAQKKEKQKDIHILSIGVDTWGVDMVYLDENKELIFLPHCYRDERTKSILNDVHNKVPLSKIYNSGGNAYFHFNSVYQLYHDYHTMPILKEKMKKFVFMPDYFCYILGAELSAEYTIASTSALTKAEKRNWDFNLIDMLNIPKDIFPEIVESPKIAGTLNSDFITETTDRNKEIKIIKVAGHDSACAVTAAPLKENSCFLICGSWFLLGIENDNPLISDNAFKNSIVNEGNPFSKFRVLKLFMGFWILHQLKKEWNKAGDAMSYSDFAALASLSPLKDKTDKAFDIEDERLNYPKSMEAMVCHLCKEQDLSKQDILYLTYRSMALACKKHIESIESVSKKKIETIITIGGGVQDTYFMQELENISTCKIHKGPVEASVLGNGALQFMAHGKIKNISELRSSIEKSILYGEKEYV